MNFLSPWFLAGALLIAGPIIAHLIRRSTRDRTLFSATRFLSESAPRLQRRNRVQNPLLLLLRCLIVGLLAIAFSRPFLADPPTKTVASMPSQDVVILLDESASMRRASLWKDGRDRVHEFASALQPSDRCTILTVAHETTTLMSAQNWTQLESRVRPEAVRTLLDAREPSWGPTYLDSAVDAALDIFAETPDGVRRRLIVVSDFAAGSRIAGLAARDWPSGLEVTLDRVSAPLTNNAGLQWMGWSETDPQKPLARFRVTRDRGALPLPLKLQLLDPQNNQPVGIAEDIELGPGETRLVSIALPPEKRDPLRAALSGDTEAFDNQVWIVPPTIEEITVVYLGDHDATNPQHALYYLARAMSSASSAKLTLRSLPTTTAATTLPASPLLFVNGDIGADLVEALRNRMAQGAYVVSLLESPARVPNAAALSGEIDWQSKNTEDRYALLGKVDFQHPLFALFADPRFSDFSQVRFWRPTRLQLPASSPSKIVAAFDDDSAALVDTTVGQGHHLVFGSDWNPRSTQWILSTKFIPWLENLIERASGGPAQPTSVEIGAPSTFTRNTGVTWQSLQANAAPILHPSQPGAYRANGDTAAKWIALQVPAEESRTDVLPIDTFEQLGMPLRVPASANRSNADPGAQANAVATESRQKIWRWILCLVAGFLALESIVAYALTRRESTTPQPVGGGS